jgi:hypothetical protein
MCAPIAADTRPVARSAVAKNNALTKMPSGRTRLPFPDEQKGDIPL